MTIMPTLQFGDRVRHNTRPEWGIGDVVKVESVHADGQPIPRITVRFPSEGLKVLTGESTPLEPIAEDRAAAGESGHRRPPIAEIEDLERSGMTTAVERKIQEMMLAIPLPCCDGFNAPDFRLKRTLDLYRFDLSGRGLMDWAIMQTGMDDPLTRFNRTELESWLKRWSFERDNVLAGILNDMRDDKAAVDAMLRAAPQSARRAVNRIRSGR